MIAVLGSTACIKPPPIGYIVPGPQKKGEIILGVQGGTGGGVSVNGPSLVGGGALQIEPFVTSRLSLPVTVALIGGLNMDSGYDSSYVSHFYGQARLGLRYRHLNNWIVGGGLSSGLAYVESCPGHESPCRIRPGGNLSLDFEWGYSKRWKRKGISFAQRLTWDAVQREYFDFGSYHEAYIGLHLTNEITAAYYGRRDKWIFTTTLGLGITSYNAAWAFVALGFVVML